VVSGGCPPRDLAFLEDPLETGMSLTKQVVTSIKWTVGMRMLAQAVTWCSTVLVMRLLSPDDYGLMAMSGFAVAFLGLVAELGLGAALIQAAELDPKVIRQVFGVVILVNSLVILILVSTAPILALYFEEPRMMPIVQAISLQFIPAALAVVPESLLKRRMQFRTLSLIEFSGTIASMVITLSLALAGAGVWTLVAGALTLSVWKAAAVNLVAPTRFRPLFSFQGVRHHVLFGGRLTLTGLLWFLFSEFDIFLAGRTLGATALGYYSISKHAASLPLQRISQVVNQVIYPAFSQIQRQPELVAAQMLRSVRLISFVAVPVVWGISCVAREIVLVILGAKWQPAILPLQILCLVIPFRVIAGATGTVAQSLGRADVILTNSIVSSLVMPAAFWVGSQYGLIGLSLVWATVYPCVLVFNLQRTVRAIGVRGRELVRVLLPSVSAGLGMYMAVSATRLVLPAGVPGSVLLVFLVAVGVVAYAGLSLTFNRGPVHEIVALVR
jgi:teichuronic acid exporter